MNACYILYSENLGKFYVGATHDNIETRLESHNSKKYGKHRFTATASDWTLYIVIETSDFSQAVRIERKIKSMKSSKYIQNLKLNPEIIDNL